MPLYDSIGRTYGTTRRADPRIESMLHSALGELRSLGALDVAYVLIVAEL